MSVGERRGHDRRRRCTGGLGRGGERLLGRLTGAGLGEGVGRAGGAGGRWGRQRHDPALHGGHPPDHHLRLLQPVLQLLRPHLVLDVEAEGDATPVLLALHGVGAAQGEQPLAHAAAGVGCRLPADVGVLHQPLHLLAGRQGAVGVATLAGMDQGALGGHIITFGRRLLLHDTQVNVLTAERERGR